MVGVASVQHGACGAHEIKRRPRGASRAALAPTFVSGQLFLWDLRANALAHGALSRRTNKAVARACNRRDWPETNVGASAARDAPHGRRSISQTLQDLRQTLTNGSCRGKRYVKHLQMALAAANATSNTYKWLLPRQTLRQTPTNGSAAANAATAHPASAAHACLQHAGPRPGSAAPACANPPPGHRPAARYHVHY